MVDDVDRRELEVDGMVEVERDDERDAERGRRACGGVNRVGERGVRVLGGQRDDRGVDRRVEREPAALGEREGSDGGVEGVAEREAGEDLRQSVVHEALHGARLRVRGPRAENGGGLVYRRRHEVGQEAVHISLFSSRVPSLSDESHCSMADDECERERG